MRGGDSALVGSPWSASECNSNHYSLNDYKNITEQSDTRFSKIKPVVKQSGVKQSGGNLIPNQLLDVYRIGVSSGKNFINKLQGESLTISPAPFIQDPQ